MLASTPLSPQLALTIALALSIYTLLFNLSCWELIAVACCNDVAQQCPLLCLCNKAPWVHKGPSQLARSYYNLPRLRAVGQSVLAFTVATCLVTEMYCRASGLWNILCSASLLPTCLVTKMCRHGM